MADAFAVLGVLAGGDVNAVLPEDRGGDDFARAFRSGILDGLAVLGFVFRRVGVVFPDRLEEGAVGFLLGSRVEGVAEAFAAAEEDEVLAVDLAGRGRAPLAVEETGTNLGVVLAEEFAGLFVHCHEAGRERGGDVHVRPVLAVRGGDVEHVADDEDGAVGGVVRKNAQFIHHVVAPDDVGVLLAGRDERSLLAVGTEHVLHDVFGLVLVRAVVAVRHAFDVEAEDFAARGDDVEAVAFDDRRGEQAEAFPVVDLAGLELGDDKLPVERAGLLIEAEEDGAVAEMLLVAWHVVVGADVDAAISDGGVAVALRAELHGELHVLLRGAVVILGALHELARLEAVGQARGDRIHIAVLSAAPLAPIAAGVGGLRGRSLWSFRLGRVRFLFAACEGDRAGGGEGGGEEG